MANFQELPGLGVIRAASVAVIGSSLLTLLYLGRAVFEPLAIAVLLAFVLSPPIRWLRRHHIGRVTSVIAVVGFALATIAAFSLVMETELTRLAGEVPKYQSNLREKIISINGALVSSGTIKQASTTLSNLAAELRNNPADGGAQHDLEGQKPVPVELYSRQPAAFEYLQNVIGPFVGPLTMAGLLVLFLVFILFYREDLRDRVLRLAGTGDLHRTTEAMNDAGKRLSRFFLIQSAINGAFGFCISLGLWAFGVPNPVLWGMLAGSLRFVPYVGTPIAAVIPILLAAAIEPGWAKALATGGLFLGLELITGQAVEPVLQGQHTGLSPVAIVISQLFWTLIWGPPGLLLAVPITVCIAVLGRHIDALSTIGVLLGDEPALAPHEGFYQRILAGDVTEATFQAEQGLVKEPLSAYYDAVPMAALALAQSDAAEGKLSREEQAELLGTIEEIVEDLADYSDEMGPAQEAGAEHSSPEKARAGEAGMPAASRGTHPILLVAARNALDQSASVLLAHILEKRGLASLVEPFDPARPRRGQKAWPDARLVCVSCFGALQNPAPVRYLIRRLKRQLPEARFIACFWLLDGDAAKLEEWRKIVGADFVAASLREAACICSRETPTPPEAEEPAESLKAAE